MLATHWLDLACLLANNTLPHISSHVQVLKKFPERAGSSLVIGHGSIIEKGKKNAFNIDFYVYLQIARHVCMTKLFVDVPKVCMMMYEHVLMGVVNLELIFQVIQRLGHLIQLRTIRREFGSGGPTFCKNPLDVWWGLLPTLWWVGSWLPTYLASFFPSSR